MVSRTPTWDEVTKANKQLQRGKALFKYCIPPEIFKEGGEAVTVQLSVLVHLF